MAFVKEAIDYSEKLPDDARDRFRKLAPRIIRAPHSTQIIETTTQSGKTRFLVVEQSIGAKIGDLVVVPEGMKMRLRRLDETIKPEHVWGRVLWVMMQE